MTWLIRDGEVLAAAEIARHGKERRKGLLGRQSINGALVITPCKGVHTFRMKFPIDVAWINSEGRVLRTRTMKPWRLSLLIPRAQSVIEAEEGAFERWGLHVNDTIEIKD